MTVKRMDNVGIVVEDIDAAVEFFTELGLELEGRAPIEGDWADGVTGLRDMRVEIAMMRTPDGHSRLEMSRFLAPPVVADHRSAPVNALGYLRVMFTVEDIDDTLARLGKRGAGERQQQREGGGNASQQKCRQDRCDVRLLHAFPCRLDQEDEVVKAGQSNTRAMANWASRWIRFKWFLSRKLSA